MNFDWPSDTSARFRHEVIRGTHDVHASELFSDDGIADLLDRYPRDELGIFTFPPHREGTTTLLRGQAPTADGKTLLEAVKRGHMWLNLRNAGKHLPEYLDVENAVFEQLEKAAGEKTFKRDCGVLISSPNKHVHYHLDIPMVCLVHLRGQKTMYVYPRNEPFAPLSQVESIALRESEEDLSYDNQFQKDAIEVVLNPGDVVTWPQNAPHRVQNADNLCVSLSCEFMTSRALVRANAIYANGIMRRKFGHTPSLGEKIGSKEIVKAAIARAAKLLQPPPERGPTPITFELDEATLDLVELTS